MSKVTVTSGNVTVEGETQKDIFQTLATYQEVFGTCVCKGCSKGNLLYTVREQKDSKGKNQKYYELRCRDCFAKLSFGQHLEDPTLFPKKWTRWDKQNSVEVEL